MRGFDLHKSGSRVKELLERQFIVPTLESAPNENTTQWQDGKYVVNFRIGELCRVSEGENYVFYRLYAIVGDKAIWQKANASELPDLSDYYTKREVDYKISQIDIPIVDLSDYYTKEETDRKIEEHTPDLSNHYTKEEVDQKVEEGISKIEFPEDESIKNVTEDEYNALFESDTLSEKTMYFVSKDGSPIALYIGKVQIAVREEGSKGFAYNFPIIF